MATYLIKQGCEDDEEDIIDDVTACVDDPEGQAGTKRTKSEATAATGLSGCGRGTKSKDSGQRKPLTEDDLRQLLTRQVEEAQRKEREERLKGLADGRLAYLQKTHYSSAWRETGIIPPRGQRGDDGDFHRGQNIGSRTSIAGLNHYVPPIVDLPMRAVGYLEEHKIIYLLEEILTEMLVRRPTSPRRYLLNWLKNVRGPIEKPSVESTPSTGTLCSSCLDEKKPTEKLRIELCDCQESYEDLRTEAEKRKDIPLTPKLVDPQQWLWEEEEKEEKESERGDSNDGSEMEEKGQAEETDSVEEAAASEVAVSEPGIGGGEDEEGKSSEKSEVTEEQNEEAVTEDAERTEQSKDQPDDGENGDVGGVTAENEGSEENADKTEEDAGAEAESGENKREETGTNEGSASGTSEQPVETEQAPAENADENIGDVTAEVEAAAAEDGSEAQEDAGTAGTAGTDAAQETEQPEDADPAE